MDSMDTQPPLTRGELRLVKRAVVEDRVDLVARLIELTVEQLEGMPIPADVRVALNVAYRLKAGGAKQRQIRFTAKMLTGRDLELRDMIADYDAGELILVTRPQQWRDHLVAKGDVGIQALAALCPEADRHRLRTQVRQEQRRVETSGRMDRLLAYLGTLELPDFETAFD